MCTFQFCVYYLVYYLVEIVAILIFTVFGRRNFLMKKYLSLVVVVLLLAVAGSAFASDVGSHGTQTQTEVVETPVESPTLNLSSTETQAKVTTGLGSDAAGLAVVDMTNDADTTVTQPSAMSTSNKTAVENLANSSSTKPKTLNIMGVVSVTVKKVITSGVDTSKMTVGEILQFFVSVIGNRAVSVEAADEANGVTYSFLDKDGNTIERVPEDKVVNLAMVAEPGNEYTLAVGAGEATTPTSDPGSSGGGCSAGFTALALVALGGFIAARKK